MNPQLEGIEHVPGTYPFDLRTSIRALRLNRFFWGLARPENRDLFLENQAEAFARAGLTEEERALVVARDWLGLIRYGVNFFVLEKFARVVRMSNLEVYASMRGESFETFMKTRRVPEAR
jgi:aromatic-ring opening dioxygenase LigAB LigA subunit